MSGRKRDLCGLGFVCREKELVLGAQGYRTSELSRPS